MAPEKQLINLQWPNGYIWCFSDGFTLKIYLSSSSGIPKCLTCIVTIAMFDELKLPRKVMVAEVVYYLGAYARNPAGPFRIFKGVQSASQG